MLLATDANFSKRITRLNRIQGKSGISIKIFRSRKDKFWSADSHDEFSAEATRRRVTGRMLLQVYKLHARIATALQCKRCNNGWLYVIATIALKPAVFLRNVLALSLFLTKRKKPSERGYCTRRELYSRNISSAIKTHSNRCKTIKAKP